MKTLMRTVETVDRKTRYGSRGERTRAFVWDRSADHIRASGQTAALKGRIHDRTRTLRRKSDSFPLHRGRRPYMTHKLQGEKKGRRRRPRPTRAALTGLFRLDVRGLDDRRPAGDVALHQHGERLLTALGLVRDIGTQFEHAFARILVVERPVESI